MKISVDIKTLKNKGISNLHNVINVLGLNNSPNASIIITDTIMARQVISITVGHHITHLIFL